MHAPRIREKLARRYAKEVWFQTSCYCLLKEPRCHPESKRWENLNVNRERKRTPFE